MRLEACVPLLCGLNCDDVLKSCRETVFICTEHVWFRQSPAPWEAMKYPSDLPTEQWYIVRLVLVNNSKRGRKHGRDRRKVVNAMSYVTHTGCQ